MAQGDYYDEDGNLVRANEDQDGNMVYGTEDPNDPNRNATPEQIAAAERGTNFDGRSFGQQEADQWYQQAIDAGVPQGWIDAYLPRNPLDYNRIQEAYFSDADMEDTRTGAPNVNEGGGSSGGSGGGGGGGGTNNYTGPFAPPGTTGWMPSYTAPKFVAPEPYKATAFNAPDPFTAPTWDAPDAYTPGTFRAPTIEEARQEPGFEFAMEQGSKALNNSAASKGLLRTGGTMKELIGFGQKLGDQNYQNVYNRGLTTFNTNEGNAADAYKTNYVGSRDAFDRTYGGAKDEYQSEWDTAMGNWTAGTKGAQDEYQSLWNTAVQQWQADTHGAEAEFAPQQIEAMTGFQAGMDQWLEKMRIAGLIEQDNG